MVKRIFCFVIAFFLLSASTLFAAIGQENKPRPPKGGFSVLIENNNEITNNRSVVLLINGGDDVDRMSISNKDDFSIAGIQPYQKVFEWNLPEEEGVYTVYVKVYTRYGVSSDVFSDSIIYQKKDAFEKLEHRTLSGDRLLYGDLFKRADSLAVYYYGRNEKRYIFPTESVFYSWYAVEDFSRVKLVSADVLAAISIGGNIRYRFGGDLVKIKSDSKVYAVGFSGKLHWIKSESLARSLYGPLWSKKIRDISDTLFGNYSLGLSVGYIDEPPTGYIFKEKDSSAVYLVDGQLKRPFVNLNALTSNKFTFDNLVEMDTVGYGLGDPISGLEDRFVDPAWDFSR